MENPGWDSSKIGSSKGIRQDQRELLAAIAGRQVALAQAVAEHTRQALDYPVPRRVTVAVVHRFEVIDIQHGETEAVTVAQRLGQFALQGELEVDVVEQSGETVPDHELPQFAETAGAYPAHPPHTAA